MKTLPEVDDYRALLLAETPMLDLRAAIEHASGSLPSAYNLPLLNDDERHQVGICYRNNGQQAAIDLGHQLVIGELREHRLTIWHNYLTRHPQAVLYCARGGLRSKISQQWLADRGLVYPRVVGGYKALRGYLLGYLSEFCANGMVLVLSGMTGTGKTTMLRQLARAIDLEGAANHKGSSFGRPLGEQPCQVDFENRIALDLLKLSNSADNSKAVVMEDESRMIGSRQVPPELLARMADSPIAVIDMPFDQRLENLWQEYVVERHRQTLEKYGDAGEEHFASYLKDSLLRIKKRLGGSRTQQLLEQMEHALAHQQGDRFAAHRDWLTTLTQDYYDPMYRYQLAQKKQSIVFRGSASEVAEWLTSTADLT
ncbi:MAG: tRNA 2-selenouridine(34) synthase MnmH [Porticoccaceae bacterium]|nr:tRNA 2-selenouridine(34) synthase MnmH [Porticoccaceae bacterium]